MMACIQLDDVTTIQRLRDDYIRALVLPMDGMWESTVIAHATFWEIQDQGQFAGYFCLDDSNVLLRFSLLEKYLGRSEEIFRWVISTYRIHSAITSTIEPLYFSLCLDVQRSIELSNYLFRDGGPVELSSGLSNSVLRLAEKGALDEIVCFYRANTEGDGAWIEPFLHKRLDQQELFVLLDRQMLLASGECIPSPKQVPYADLGMIVAQAYRGRGLGSFMLTQLKKHCYEVGWMPICSCSADNHASKKAIEKAGFVSEQRMVKVQF
jgi:GNAT superfamily N-acetyltransferase